MIAQFLQRMLTISVYLLLLLATVVPAREKKSDECLYKFIVQPPKTILDVCNPFNPSSLTLECSILVLDNRPGELTIDWFFTDAVAEIIPGSSSTFATSPGAVITSNITVRVYLYSAHNYNNIIM